MALQTVVVVGASLAGLRATEALRRDGFDGRIVLVGAEPHLPYDRPPLSKQLLAGEWQPQDLGLRRAPYDELELDLRLGVRATALDAGAKVLTLDLGDGTTKELAFDGALLATGATPRTLPNTPDLDGIFVLRTVDDALDLRARLDDHPRVVVIGAGFIGSEVAATCRGLGLAVTVLEALPAPLVRGLGETLGMVCGELHRDHGVDLRLGVGVAAIEGDGKVERVRLDDGSAVEADVVVVGVGVVPVTDWLEGSGLTLDNGVVCDETLLAAPGIVAAGDVARWPNPMFDGELMRLEHWTNAAEQGVAAARRLLVADPADAVPYAPVPFVWSDQYDRKIQTVGHFRGDDEMAVVHGTLEERRFVAVFGRAGRLVGALGFSMPAKVMQYRKMIEERASFDDALERARAS
ncbi:MAG TPA: FAD-dependent oxidoreductase [Acidimicrobiia bacterium]|jgi:NADPH-dependent 2,4-dienoyl-CoA reductase/sulfur reductase-like enzyme